MFLFVRDSPSFQNSIFHLLRYQREPLSLSILCKHYFVWHFPRLPFAQLNMRLYLLPFDLEPCGRTHCNFSEHFSWNGKCTVQLLHHLSSIRPRFKSAQCSTSLFGQRHVRHHCLVQCIAQLFSYIGMQKFEHFSISLIDFPGKCNSWPTFPTLPTISHCVVMVPLYVRPRCQGTVGVVSRNLVCPKPYSVCMSARRPAFITPDRASSRMHSLLSAKNWAQCVFPSKQNPNTHFFIGTAQTSELCFQRYPITLAVVWALFRRMWHYVLRASIFFRSFNESTLC